METELATIRHAQELPKSLETGLGLPVIMTVGTTHPYVLRFSNLHRTSARHIVT